MTDELHEPLPTTIGTEAETIDALDWCHVRLNPLAVAIAQRHVREGHRAVELAGVRYEIGTRSGVSSKTSTVVKKAVIAWTSLRPSAQGSRPLSPPGWELLEVNHAGA